MISGQVQPVRMCGGALKILRRAEAEGHMADESIPISPMTRFRFAMILAILADALQLIFFPIFVEGAESPVDDALDLGVGAALFFLLGWHWEFLPSALAKLVPGVDLIPCWTIAVASVYRKSKQIAAQPENTEEHRG
jgi:hypothetical protein